MVDAESRARLFCTEYEAKDRVDNLCDRWCRSAGIFWNEGWRISRYLDSFVNAEGASAKLRWIQRQLFRVPLLDGEAETRREHDAGSCECEPAFSTDPPWLSRRPAEPGESGKAGENSRRPDAHGHWVVRTSHALL